MGTRKKSKHGHPPDQTATATPTPNDSRVSLDTKSDPPGASTVSLPVTSSQVDQIQKSDHGLSENKETVLAGASGKPAGAAEESVTSIRKGWYGGTWRRKPTGASDTSSEVRGTPSKPASVIAAEASPTMFDVNSQTSHTNNIQKSGEPSVPSQLQGTGTADASAATLNVPSVDVSASGAGEAAKTVGGTTTPSTRTAGETTAIDSNKELSASEQSHSTADVEQKPLTTGGPRQSGIPLWRGWWSRPDQTDLTTAKPPDHSAIASDQGAPAGDVGELSAATSSTDTHIDTAGVTKPPGQAEVSLVQTGTAYLLQTTKAIRPPSWFWSWSASQNYKSGEQPSQPESQGVSGATQPVKIDEPTMSKAPDKSVEVDAQKPPSQQPAKASGWVFWSRDTSKGPTSEAEGGIRKSVGELAVANTPSQSMPEEAQFNEELRTVDDKNPPAKKTSVRSKEPRKSTSSIETAQLPKPGKVLQSSESITYKKRSSAPGNHLVPSFASTYPRENIPSYWQAFRRYMLGDGLSHPHLQISSRPPRIRKAIAIGVHGYVPAALVQRVIGVPTGTSIRFAIAAENAIRSWATSRGLSYDMHIDKVALEGEGLIKDRVDTLWKLLLNWVDEIRSADFIFVACHSQGVPVAVMLLAKLMSFGCVGTNTRVGVCAMAGVNQGPFLEYRSRFLDRSAGELFEFARAGSDVSEEYLRALDVVLKARTRITYVGSIDDQLVSLESSIYANVSHPYIYRAAFIDGRVHAPDFITHLISLVLKLRNLGISDHGLIRELSPALAGSLYSGEGHSRIHEEEECYLLAVRHALETTSLSSEMALKYAPLHSQSKRAATHSTKLSESNISNASKPEDAAASSASTTTTTPMTNPYFLPWAMRGVLEEDKVRNELTQEVDELLRLFEDWRPSSKQLKDVKFRLDAVRSKL